MMPKKDFLHFEDVGCQFPKSLNGDMFLFPDSIVFLSFPKRSFFHSFLIFGILGFVLRANAFNKWRDQWRGRDPRALVDEYPHSWKLSSDEIVDVSHTFITLKINTTKSAKAYKIQLGYPQWNQIREFGEMHGYNISVK